MHAPVGELRCHQPPPLNASPLCRHTSGYPVCWATAQQDTAVLCLAPRVPFNSLRYLSAKVPSDHTAREQPKASCRSGTRHRAEARACKGHVRSCQAEGHHSLVHSGRWSLRGHVVVLEHLCMRQASLRIDGGMLALPAIPIDPPPQHFRAATRRTHARTHARPHACARTSTLAVLHLGR